MGVTRRVALAVLGAMTTIGVGTACSAASVPPAAPGSPPARRVGYGLDASQFGMLHLPPGEGRVPVVMVIHGGYWGQGYGLELGTPLAVDLANAGFAAWNVEYRRLGAGGGFPATLVDVATALDAVAGPLQDAAGGRLDPARVVLVGHSAGGQLAVWAASRTRLPPGAPGAGPMVQPRGTVSQAGVLDLAAAADQGLGGGAVTSLLGGSPAQVPDRYALASPTALVPAPTPVVCVHGRDDTTVPIDQSMRYVAAATAARGSASLRLVDGADHFALIDPSTAAWAVCRQALLSLA